MDKLLSSVSINGPSMQIFIETERLILRELLETDAEGMFALDSDPEVHKYLGDKPVHTIDQVQEVIRIIRQQYAENGIGRWAVIEKKSQNFLGWSGLKLMRTVMNGHTGYYDIGYRLIRKYWGKGFATESAIAARDYAFDTLGLPEIFGTAHVNNAASNHILQKIGLQFVEQYDFEGLPCNWYRCCNPIQ